MNKTLPTDSKERKTYPMLSGCLKYFPAALAGVANISNQGNEKHNPGQPLHHNRDKSGDHGDCLLRHLTDTEDLLAGFDRGQEVTKEQILEEVNCLAWRALAYSQELHERFGAPLAPGAKKEKTEFETHLEITKEYTQELFKEDVKAELGKFRSMLKNNPSDLIEELEGEEK